MNLTRKSILGAFATGVTVLTLASTAFACVTFRGDLTVTGTTSGNKVTGDEGSMTYCVAPTSAGTSSYNNAITVTVAVATSCVSSTNKLNAGTNNVKINNASTDAAVPFTYDGTKWNFVSGTGCFASPTPAGVISLGTISVTAGVGTGTFTLPHMNRIDPTNKASALCVGAGGVGIFAPLRITSI